MKIGIVSSIVPLIKGGARNLAEWLAGHLTEAGHQVETVYLPSSDNPETLLRQMTAFRLLDLGAFDRVITTRPPAHLVRHPDKVVWFIHHLRVFYDLWESAYRPLPHTASAEALRKAVVHADTTALGEASRIFTNSEVVRQRLARFNGIDAEVLYPPVNEPERFRDATPTDEIVYVSRLEPHKRQMLAIEAMRHVRTPVRLRLIGTTTNQPYLHSLRRTIEVNGLERKVAMDAHWTGEAEKEQALSTALAAAYFPLDEDSYGYPTIEAAHCGRATVTTSDAGGVLEFVRNDQTGLVVEPDPGAIADAFDALYRDRRNAARLGREAKRMIGELNIAWEHVISRLTA